MAKRDSRPRLTIVVDIPGSDRGYLERLRDETERRATGAVGDRVRVTYAAVVRNLIREAGRKLEASESTAT